MATLQLPGFDATHRVSNEKNGGTKTPAILDRQGSHVPIEKGWVGATPESYYMPNPIHHSPDARNYPSGKHAKSKIKKTMDEWKSGTLHSGSKKGPKVTSQKQAIAIALSQARKAK